MVKFITELKKMFENIGSIHEKEQDLLDKIAKKEEKLKNETNSKTKEVIAQQINQLKSQLQELYDKDPVKLKFRLEELKKELVKKETINQESKNLKKYFQYVVEKNLKNIQFESAEDLKNLCDYNTIDFDMLYENITIKGYSYNKDYLKAIENLYLILEKDFKIITQKTPNYLLSADDILKLKTGNQADISIFVCAAMHKLGDFNAKVNVAVLEDFTTIHFVQTKYKYKTLIFDFYNSHKYNDFLDYDRKIWDKYKPEGKAIREMKYAFNKFSYDEF